jgi:hypothetical protein
VVCEADAKGGSAEGLASPVYACIKCVDNAGISQQQPTARWRQRRRQRRRGPNRVTLCLGQTRLDAEGAMDAWRPINTLLSLGYRRWLGRNSMSLGVVRGVVRGLSGRRLPLVHAPRPASALQIPISSSACVNCPPLYTPSVSNAESIPKSLCAGSGSGSGSPVLSSRGCNGS